MLRARPAPVKRGREGGRGMAREVHLIEHPLVQHKLALLRRKSTSTSEFRSLVAEVGMLLAYEVNWQTVLFIGVSDLRQVSAEEADLEPASRQFFFKIGYAFQR